MQHFGSFAEVGATLFGLKPAPRKEKQVYCRNCGCRMDRVGDTNVYFCHGKTNDGKLCGNRLIRPVN